MAMAEKAVAVAITSRTPHTFAAVSRADVQSTVIVLGGTQTLHFEPLLQFLE